MNRRSLTNRIFRHALAVMPPHRSAWAEAMAAESAHIDNDGEALRFAVGAVLAGYRQQARTAGAWLLALRWWVGASAMFLGAALVRLTLVVPDAAQPPAWLRAAAILLAGCYLGAGWSYLRRRAAAFAGFLTGAVAVLVVCVFAYIRLGVATSASDWYSALLLEEIALIALFTVVAFVIPRVERRLQSRAW